MPHGGSLDSVCDLIFADNDILLKLAEYDLLREACTALHAEPDRIRFQPSTKPSLVKTKEKLAKGKAIKYSQEGIDRAIAFVESAEQVTSAADLDWVEGFDGIDIGEAQLASWTCEAGNDSVLLTGDKRFMKAVARSHAAKALFDGLRGRVICLEEIICAIMLADGVDHVRKAVKAAPECDIAISLLFGSRFDLPDEQVWDGIESLLHDITKDVGDAWLKRL